LVSSWSGVGEAPRRQWQQAIAKMKTKETSWIPAQKHYRNDVKMGTTGIKKATFQSLSN